MALALIKAGYGKETPLERGLLARFTQGAMAEIQNVNPQNWFGPGQPLRKIAPTGVQPRVFDYSTNINLDYTPKAHEGAPFALLRELADSYPLLRCVIETRKDQVSRVGHSFTLRQKTGEKPSQLKERAASDARIDALNEFFDKPDGESNFADWQRMILEDTFVIDAPAVTPRWRNDAKVYGFDVIDGATISRVIDVNGRTPVAPDTAYRQIIKGMPSVDLMQPAPQFSKRDQLFYFPRNIRTNRLYGYSPVEQIALTINLGLRRRIFQLQYYTEGTIPDVFIQGPDGASETTLQQLETMWNEKFNTTAARRKANWIPFGSKVTMAKEAVLADMMDELIIREVAYAFSISPGSLVKMVNRASGQQMSEDAKAEGLEPILFWFKGFMDGLLAFLGCPDIQFEWGTYTRENPLQQAQIDQIYLSTVDSEGHSVKVANEVRESIGLEEMDFTAQDEAKAQEMQDQQLREEQTDRADTARPKSADLARAALKKNGIGFRLAQKRHGMSRQSSARRDY